MTQSTPADTGGKEALNQLLKQAAAEQDDAAFQTLLRHISIVRAERWLTSGLRKAAVRLPRVSV